MGFEYKLTFSDPSWYSAHIARIAERVRHLPQFTLDVDGREFRLKDQTVANSWSYDLRIFLRSHTMDIEVSGRTSTFYSDFRSIYDWIRRETSAQLVDDDGIPVWEDQT